MGLKGLQEMRRRLVEFVGENGLEAVAAWGPEGRSRSGRAVVAVSLRGVESGPPGFRDYLGERYDPEGGCWEELYGKRVELTFGLDVYGESAEEVHRGLDVLGGLLERGPEGLRPVGFSAGETGYDGECKRYRCPVQARFSVWATAVSREEGSFLDFEVRGEEHA